MVFVLSGPPQRNRRPWAHRACVPFGMVGQRPDAKNPRSCLRAHDDGGEMGLPGTLKANQVTCMVVKIFSGGPQLRTARGVRSRLHRAGSCGSVPSCPPLLLLNDGSGLTMWRNQ